MNNLPDILQLRLACKGAEVDPRWQKYPTRRRSASQNRARGEEGIVLPCGGSGFSAEEAIGWEGKLG